MSEFLQKLSSYNLFNYLLPGVLFAVLGENITSFPLLQSNIVIALFTYYFFGLVISRIGSLILEPIARRFGIVSFAPYSDFVEAAKEDHKLEVLSETNNMYRTLSAMFVSLMALKGVDELSAWVHLDNGHLLLIALLLLTVLFVLSYRKQTRYIKKRVEANK